MSAPPRSKPPTALSASRAAKEFDLLLSVDEFDFLCTVVDRARTMSLAAAVDPSSWKKRPREPASKHDEYSWAATSSAVVRGAVRSAAREWIVRERRRDPPDSRALAEAADLLEEIWSDTAKVPDPKQERRDLRRFIARLVRDDVDRLAAELKRRGVPNPAEQALQTIALKRGVKAGKAEEGTGSEGEALAKWLQRNR